MPGETSLRLNNPSEINDLEALFNMTASRSARIMSCLLVALASPSPLLAQQPPRAKSAQAAPAAPAPAPAPVSNEPQSTQATFGDWTMRCVRQANAGQATRICEVTQNIQVQGQQAPLAQVAFGRLQRSDPMRLTTILPSNVTFPSSVRVILDEKDTQPFEMPWRRCVPGACIAFGEPSQAVIQRLRGRTEPARIMFKDANDRDIAIPLSLRGLPQALDALAKEVG